MGRRPCKDGGRIWREAFISQGMHRISRSLQTPKEARKESSPEPLVEAWPPTHWCWTSGTWNHERINFLYFKLINIFLFSWTTSHVKSVMSSLVQSFTQQGTSWSKPHEMLNRRYTCHIRAFRCNHNLNQQLDHKFMRNTEPEVTS